MICRPRRATILWVDDNPDINIYERQALEALGVTFVLASSTNDAIEKLGVRSFEAIISDMDRPPDSQAGYTLLHKLRAAKLQTPFIICSSRASDRRAEAKRRGAVGCTDRADELLEMVLSTLA
jgi:CheY-like chemotaxis protein